MDDLGMKEMFGTKGKANRVFQKRKSFDEDGLCLKLWISQSDKDEFTKIKDVKYIKITPKN